MVLYFSLYWKDNKITRLFVLLAAESGVGVCDLNGQLCGPLHNQLPVLWGHIVGNFSTMGPTEKEKNIKVITNSYFKNNENATLPPPNRKRHIQVTLVHKLAILRRGSNTSVSHLLQIIFHLLAMARARGRMGISSAMLFLWIQYLGWIWTIQQVWSQRDSPSLSFLNKLYMYKICV